MDARGKECLCEMFWELAEVMGCDSAETGAERFREVLLSLDLDVPTPRSSADYVMLRTSVNPVQLKNNPVCLEEDVIEELYRQILEPEKQKIK